jgi:hypothetical protein
MSDAAECDQRSDGKSGDEFHFQTPVRCARQKRASVWDEHYRIRDVRGRSAQERGSLLSCSLRISCCAAAPPRTDADANNFSMAINPSFGLPPGFRFGCRQRPM